ncbi:MAG TPA: 8-amino-7-oxononanoate synthase [Candidatus Acidoferrum sp.]|nr:8-amino-7-oxononanoate synthase [Candidatus Acidoferrum sp.]
MNSFTNELRLRLAARREKNLFRELRRVDSASGSRIQMGGQSFLNFSSNDYLGLTSHPALKSAAAHAAETYGSGVGASRLICGSLAPFHELEEMLAAFKGTDAALSFSTGYAAAIGTISALMSSDDVIILDKLVHACIVDAARLSGAKLRIFDHNNLDDLADKLKWATGRTRTGKQNPHTLIVTESVFSMDGDRAPLREIVALKEQYGVWLMVDEAHATGILGRNGRGLADELGVASQIDISMGTLGKAFGASGGYICGSRDLIDFLVNHARSFIFSTAPVPAAAAAATAGIRIVQSSQGDTLRLNLFNRVQELTSGLNLPPTANGSAIIPFMIGAEKAAVAAAAQLREHHLFIPPIRYPTVARGAARLRITLSAAHSHADVALLIRALASLGRQPQSPSE